VRPVLRFRSCLGRSSPYPRIRKAHGGIPQVFNIFRNTLAPTSCVRIIAGHLCCYICGTPVSGIRHGRHARACREVYRLRVADKSSKFSVRTRLPTNVHSDIEGWRPCVSIYICVVFSIQWCGVLSRVSQEAVNRVLGGENKLCVVSNSAHNIKFARSPTPTLSFRDLVCTDNTTTHGYFESDA